MWLGYAFSSCCCFSVYGECILASSETSYQSQCRLDKLCRKSGFSSDTNKRMSKQTGRQTDNRLDDMIHTPPTRSLYCVYTVDPKYNETAAVRPSEWIHENSDKQFNLFKRLLFTVRLTQQPTHRGCG